MILVSCTNSNEPKQIDYSDFVDKEFQLFNALLDNFGSTLLKVQNRLDTFYKWKHITCCDNCGWMKYRFANKKYPQFAENGYMWASDLDSVYQLSIWHRPTREVPDPIALKPLRKKDTTLWYHPPIVSFSKPTNFLLKEYRIINEKPFIISAFVCPYGYLTNSQTLFVIAETNLKSRELYFIGECGAKDTTGFIDNMYKSFLSIRIKENP